MLFTRRQPRRDLSQGVAPAGRLPAELGDSRSGPDARLTRPTILEYLVRLPRGASAGFRS